MTEVALVMWRHLGGLTVLAAAVALGGCSDAPDNDTGLQVSARNLPVSASPERGCEIPATLPPGGITAVDTSLTPRPDVAAEILAMEASGELVAPQALYERVQDELRRIGRGAPVVGCGVPGDLLLGVTEAGYAQIQNNEYTAWDDYNSALRMTGKYLRSATAGYYSYKLMFDGVYNLAALGQAYGQLPEVRWAEQNGYFGGRVDVCLERFGDALDTHVYVFWQGSGDCPAGCLSNSYSGFATDMTGAIEYLGQYNNSGGAQPDWFAKAQQCRNFL